MAGVRRTIAGDHAGMDTRQNPRPVGRPVRRVLLAMDLGASSVRAADEAVDMAADQGAVLLILSVVPPTALPRLGRDSDRDLQRQQRDLAARQIVARAAAKGVTATSVVWYGEPAAAIIEAAWTERPDVLVLGSRKRRSIGRLLGSVSSHVASEAPCPVVIVPA